MALKNMSACTVKTMEKWVYIYAPVPVAPIHDQAYSASVKHIDASLFDRWLPPSERGQ
jgi:hypothetical protein